MRVLNLSRIDIAHFLHYNVRAMNGGAIMAQTTNVTFRMEEELKKAFSELCSELGISMSTAFTMFAKKTVRERRIPFDLSADPFYDKDNIEELERRIANLKSGMASLKEHDLIEED